MRKTEAEWISARHPEGNKARTAAIAKIPGNYLHPTATGLFMRVSPKGKAVYGYRFANAQKKMVNGTIGLVAETGTNSLDAVSLEEALSIFSAKKRFHSTSTDGGALTVDRAFTDWLVEPKKGGEPKAALTLKRYRLWYDSLLKTKVGSLALEDISPAKWMEVLSACKKVSAHETRVVYWMLNGLYKHFVTMELVRRNPLDTRPFKDRFAGKDTRTTRTTAVASVDLMAFVTGIQSMRGKRNEAKRALMLILLLGWRLNGVLQMRWDQIDFGRSIYEVKAKDTGWKGYVGFVAINTYAMAYITERKAEGGDLVSEYVFPSPVSTAKKPYRTDLSWAIKAAAKLLGYAVIVHDLRRTFATIAEIVLDGNVRLVGLLLAHKQVQRTDDKQGTDTDEGYIIRNLSGEVHSGTRVAEAILELAGVFPLSDDVQAKFAARGIDIKQRIPLAELKDDDT